MKRSSWGRGAPAKRRRATADAQPSGEQSQTWWEQQVAQEEREVIATIAFHIRQHVTQHLVNRDWEVYLHHSLLTAREEFGSFLSLPREHWLKTELRVHHQTCCSTFFEDGVLPDCPVGSPCYRIMAQALEAEAGVRGLGVDVGSSTGPPPWMLQLKAYLDAMSETGPRRAQRLARELEADHIERHRPWQEGQGILESGDMTVPRPAKLSARQWLCLDRARREYRVLSLEPTRARLLGRWVEVAILFIASNRRMGSYVPRGLEEPKLISVDWRAVGPGESPRDWEFPCWATVRLGQRTEEVSLRLPVAMLAMTRTQRVEFAEHLVDDWASHAKGEGWCIPLHSMGPDSVLAPGLTLGEVPVEDDLARLKAMREQ
jgi:hypothetical protein